MSTVGFVVENLPRRSRRLLGLAAQHRREWDRAVSGVVAGGDPGECDWTGELIDMVESGVPIAEVVEALLGGDPRPEDSYVAYVAATVVEWAVHHALLDDALMAQLIEALDRSEIWRAMMAMVWVAEIDVRRMPSTLRRHFAPLRSVSAVARSRRRDRAGRPTAPDHSVLRVSRLR